MVAFTATQIPDIAGRVYPAELAGELYPNGIPIEAEDQLEQLIAGHEVDEVVFAYSDVTHEHVMHIASRVLAAGASFRLISPAETMLTSTKPSIAICAVRTGSGKSQTTRHVAALLRESGKRVAVLRHPMPYGELTKQAVQRFERYEDLDAADATIEEREEYEPHIAEGNLVFAGIDYAAILDRAEQEADVILWDGGNNDTPFVKPERPRRRRRPAPAGPRAALPPGRDEPAHGRRLRREQGRQRHAGGDGRRARRDPRQQPRREDRPGRLAVRDRGRRRGDRRQARARDRGRADADPRRDDLRRRGARRQGPRRGRADRPALRGGRLDREDLRGLPERRRRCCRRWATAASRWTT